MVKAIGNRAGRRQRTTLSPATAHISGRSLESSSAAVALEARMERGDALDSGAQGRGLSSGRPC